MLSRCYLILLFVAFYVFVPVRIAGIKGHQYYVGDEYHTIYAGMVAVHTGNVVNFRAPEGSRLMVRALYPFALIKMNQVLGGDIFTLGWDFSDTGYLAKNFPNPGEITNPSIQDFLIAMRSMTAVLVFLTFLPLLYELYLRRLWFTPLFVIICAGASQLLFTEQFYLYVEPLQLGVFNLLLTAVIRCIRIKIMGWPSVLALAALAAFTIATKISAVFATSIPLTAIIYSSWAERGRLASYLLLFAGGVVGFFCLFNYPGILTFDSPTYTRFLHDTVSNFWHYAAGHDHMDEAGWPHLLYIIRSFQSTFGYMTALIPLWILIGWLLGDKNDRWLIFSISICLIATFGALAAQNIYVARNSAPWIGIIAFVAGYSVDIVQRRVAETKRALNAAIFGALVLACILLIGIGAKAAAGPNYLRKFMPRPKAELQAFIKAKISDGQIKRVLAVDYMPEAQVPVTNEESVPLLTHEGFSAYEKSWFKKLDAETAVVIYRCKRNFQLTNYILPKVFTHYRRIGDYFFFENADPKLVALELARP